MKDIFQEKGDTMHLLRHNKIVKYHILVAENIETENM